METSDKEGLLAVCLYPRPGSTTQKKCTIEEEFNGTLAEGVIRKEDLKDGIVGDLTQSLRSWNAYVNVHTRNCIMGELRGQVEIDQYVELRDEDPRC